MRKKLTPVQQIPKYRNLSMQTCTHAHAHDASMHTYIHIHIRHGGFAFYLRYYSMAKT